MRTPRRKNFVAIASGCVVGVLSFGLFGYVIWMASATDKALTMSMWHRVILELVSLLAGNAIGTVIGSGPRENRVIG